MPKISRNEIRSLLEALFIGLIILAVALIYQTATEPLFLARQNHLLGVIACGVAALGVFIARMQV